MKTDEMEHEWQIERQWISWQHVLAEMQQEWEDQHRQRRKRTDDGEPMPEMEW